MFLSARPESYKGLTEAESFRHFFTPLLLQRRLFCTPVLLLGSLQAGPQAVLNYAVRRRYPLSFLASHIHHSLLAPHAHSPNPAIKHGVSMIYADPDSDLTQGMKSKYCRE